MRRRSVRRAAAIVVALTVSLPLLGAVTATPAAAAVGDEVIAWVEVEDGVIAGGPGFNSGDHGNFSGTGSYTFRETGMASTMSVTAPAAGVYPVYVRYAAGPLGADENVTRSMGLLTNGGARQLMSLPMTSFDNWEAWRFVRYDVALNQGANTVAIQCNRGTDFCRLNFDAIQVGGTAPDPCAATPTDPGYSRMFDGTLDSFDGWRKAGAGGFGRQTGCFIRGFGGRGATWYTEQQAAPYTLDLDWRRGASDRESSVYLASSSRGGADPVGGFRIPIGTNTGAIVPTGGAAQPADPTALAGAVKPVGQWNTYRIQLTTSLLRVYLNGTLINTMTRPGTIPATGFIGLENRAAGNAVDFKDVQIQPDLELGELAAPFTRAVLAGGSLNPGGESTLGNLVAEAQRWATRGPAYGAQIAFVSPDALGNDLRGNPGGYPTTVTLSQAAAVQPSADPLVNLRLTGQQIRTVLEQQWQRTSGGAVPDRPFVRLGTSTGFAYTYDPSRAEGSRVTGMWLDGATIVPATSYSVTAAQSLASGGDNFRVFADGSARQDTGTVGRSALVDYLEAQIDPLVSDRTQHSVGVAFPGGQKTSYAAGASLSVDLTSLSFSSAPDQQDASVQVSLGGRSLGTYPVDNTLGSDGFDEHGAAAVRAVIPADAAGGPATVRIVGTSTGTTVDLPITVVAGSTTSVTAAPVAVTVKRGTTSLAVKVASGGGTARGQVQVSAAGSKTDTATLVGGRATVRVGPFATPGRKAVSVRYLGNATTRPSSRTVTVLVRKAAPTIRVKVLPGKVLAGRTKAQATIRVAAPGITPTGRVKVTVGHTTYTRTVKDGVARIRLARFSRAGVARLRVTYSGDALVGAASTSTRISVKKPR